MIKNMFTLKVMEELKSIFKLFNLNNSYDILLVIIAIISCIYILAKAFAGAVMLSIVTIVKLIINSNKRRD